MSIDPSFLRDCAVLIPAFGAMLFLGFALGRRRRIHTPLAQIKALGACRRDSFARGAAYGFALTPPPPPKS